MNYTHYIIRLISIMIVPFLYGIEVVNNTGTTNTYQNLIRIREDLAIIQNNLNYHKQKKSALDTMLIFEKKIGEKIDTIMRYIVFEFETFSNQDKDTILELFTDHAIKLYMYSDTSFFYKTYAELLKYALETTQASQHIGNLLLSAINAEKNEPVLQNRGFFNFNIKFTHEQRTKNKHNNHNIKDTIDTINQVQEKYNNRHTALSQAKAILENTSVYYDDYIRGLLNLDVITKETMPQILEHAIFGTVNYNNLTSNELKQYMVEIGRIMKNLQENQETYYKHLPALQKITLHQIPELVLRIKCSDHMKLFLRKRQEEMGATLHAIVQDNQKPQKDAVQTRKPGYFSSFKQLFKK